uniref:Uncharacterized protein n=1 Tax=Amphiprion ocellaris TaxID=80972 RepID=A0A3Q1AWX8_AMPOC
MILSEVSLNLILNLILSPSTHTHRTVPHIWRPSVSRTCDVSPCPSHVTSEADMAEYSQAGLLAALLLFTALTVRDVYLGRSSPHRGQQPADRPGHSPDSLPDTEPGRAAKASLYSGPVLRFRYCIS